MHVHSVTSYVFRTLLQHQWDETGSSISHVYICTMTHRNRKQLVCIDLHASLICFGSSYPVDDTGDRLVFPYLDGDILLVSHKTFTGHLHRITFISTLVWPSVCDGHSRNGQIKKKKQTCSILIQHYWTKGRATVGHPQSCQCVTEGVWRRLMKVLCLRVGLMTLGSALGLPKAAVGAECHHPANEFAPSWL